ncbi:hypothetical protein [Streptomyces caniscabiei]|uniref:Uncharacterized protein n=1 Tax=Streptomyces caniscabiei TaxID=2746961 RepID=A0A927LB44_9ACTN|nr:hypothetical protein [Streptomyces caniscabiei]MBD9728740.1 hypothetical protein [Streptomyces caniscabiei]MDX3514117.1 hypothetical protein [Streptomyces caniscabiei]MDX3723287.1 hypothetical protein [Streptomyces caniscabiei]WEO26671.1 hypothetical protein IHE65_27895 [Streptomyces caniscabiei]
MEFLVLLAVIAVVVTGIVVRQLRRYPVGEGERVYALHPKYSSMRRPLRDARTERDDVLRDCRQQIARAENAVAIVEQQGQQEIQALREKRQEQRREVAGDHLGTLGELVLHEHVLYIMHGARDGQEVPAEPRFALPLQGLHAERVESRDLDFIRVTWPQGQESCAYTRHGTQTVEDFTNQICTAVKQDGADRARRQERVAELEAGIRTCQAETARLKAEAERSRDKLVHSLLTVQRRAEDDWATALARWETDKATDHS